MIERKTKRRDSDYLLSVLDKRLHTDGADSAYRIQQVAMMLKVLSNELTYPSNRRNYAVCFRESDRDVIDSLYKTITKL